MEFNLNNFPPALARNIAASWAEESRSAKFENFPAFLQEQLIDVLNHLGIKELYAHQAQCISSIHSGNNVIISTGTASGKSLCYQVPIISSILENEQATALLLFPTKALSADQLKGFSNIASQINTATSKKIRIGIYDGDSSSSARLTIRKYSNVIISNPDMLHFGILPHHPAWERFFSNLKFVVIDEAHIYSGIFGSHFVNLIRRLKRITSYYGSKPQFILASATISEPEDFAEQLIENDVKVFKQDFSPKGKKKIFFYNPPVINRELGVRKSMTDESIAISEYLLSKSVQAISFTRSRISVEMIYKKMTDHLSKDVASKISPYRSGYAKSERRKIENGLKNREIELVIATIALELGIDMGMVDAIIMNGYPGSLTRFLQQSGRAGRKNKDALCIMVASSLPIDQYIIHHPEFIKNKLVEKRFLNGNNPYILFSHLRAAAFELPFHQGDGFGNLRGEYIQEYIDILQKIGTLLMDNGKYFWTSSDYPAAEISLRSIGGAPVQLFVTQNDKRVHIGEIDSISSKKFIHPEAIYLHQGEPYLADTLDIENCFAELRPAHESIYFTKPIVHINTEILNILKEQKRDQTIHGFGEVKVSEWVKGFSRHLWESQIEVGKEDLDMEPDILETKGGWLQFSEITIQQMSANGLETIKVIDYGPEWPTIRERILERDRFTCQLCGTEKNKNELHVHHKNPVRFYSTPKAAHTNANLVTLCQHCHKIAERNLRVRSSLSGLGFGLQNIVPIFVKCSPNDIGITYDNSLKSSIKLPGIFYYDQFPGGIGLSEMIHKNIFSILEALSDHINSCLCKNGCPSCVGPGGENGFGAKNGVNHLLEIILDSDI